MLNLICKDCHNIMYIDEDRTSKSFMADIEISKVPIRDIGTIYTMQYLIYVCPFCDLTLKLTYKEWETLYREQVMKEVKHLKRVMMLSHINLNTINPDNGISYCGKCGDGYDGEGNCLNDIIKQCTIKYE